LDLNPRTAVNYGNYFLRYRDWFRSRGYWSSAEDLLRDYESIRDPKERYRHVDVLKEYIRSKGTGTKDKRNTWYAVRSFYAFHRLPLPNIPRSEASRLFEPNGKDKRRSLELAPLMVEDVRRLVLNSPQPYRAIFITLFQSAMGLAEFEVFNRYVWRRIVDRLDTPGPVRVDLYREKTSRTAVKKYYTFIGEDAKNQIKDWLRIRPETSCEALFVTYNKNERRWVPVRGRLIGNMITRISKRIGLIRPNGLNRYRIHAHEFRDLFKSLCTLSGVNHVASEFFLGHSIDKLGYDKSPEYDEEWFRNEYLKVEPRLNIISNPNGKSLEERIETSKNEAVIEAVRSFARALGIDPMRIRIEREKEIGRELTGEEEFETLQEEIRRLVVQPAGLNGNNNHRYETKLVKEDELIEYLNEGWDIVKELSSGKIVIRRPLNNGA